MEENKIVYEPSRKRGVPLAVFLICLFLALFIGAIIALISSSIFVAKMGLTPSKTYGSYVDESKLESLKEQIDRYYIRDYKDEDLEEGAYKGFIEGLGDPYSAYMTSEEYKEEQESYSGSYSGIGITFNENDKGYYEVSEVQKGSPAEEAGIAAGDLILTVEGKRYETSNEMARHIRGEDGTKVNIEYMHKGKTKKVEIVRKKIEQKSVEWKMLDDETGYIRIGSFIETTGEDFQKALEGVEKKGAKYLVLDLRNNGGGLVDQCVKVADEFLDKGVVAHVEDKNGKTETYDAEDGKTGLKTVVLINEYSASASEILSYALKDNGFTIVGEKSYGKGVIQVTLPQKDGSALELTIMEYLSPDKHKVHEKGVKPTVEIEDDPDTETDEQLEKAKEEVKKQ